jgi:alkylation response protein AidB-like acyl-CoA dehydrogenase
MIRRSPRGSCISTRAPRRRTGCAVSGLHSHRWFAQLEIGYRLGRILVYRESLRQAPKGFSAATKCFCTEHEWRVAQFVARVLGPEAMVVGDSADDVSRGLLYAPAYTIMGGTSNVMRNILGERVLGLPREPRR